MSIQNPNTDPYEQQTYTAPGASTGYDPVTGAPYAPTGSEVPPPPPTGYPGYVPGPNGQHVPNPLLAGLLGFIPGVGAMYNGQFAKGLAHIAVFAVFTSLADHVSGIFGLFVAGWVIYMAFEAYQTAIARRNGQPLPDPFGLNNIGERFGFHSQQHPDLNSAWAQTVGRMPGAAPFAEESRADSTGAAYYSRTDATGTHAGYQVDPAGNVYTAGGPAVPPPGYVPPAAPWSASTYGAPYGVPPVPPPPPGYGVPPAPGYGVPPVPPVPPARGGLPTGALWLIGLGFFALLGSLHPFASLEGEATGGLFLIGLAGFMFYRRYSVTSAMYPAGSPAARWNLIRASRGAGIILVIGILTLLDGLHVARWHDSGPILLIFLGIFMVLERVAMNNMNSANQYTAYPGYSASPVPPPPDTAAPVTATEDGTSIVPKYSRPANDLSINPDDRGEGR